MKLHHRWAGVVASLLLVCTGLAQAQVPAAPQSVPLWPAGHLPQNVTGPEQVGNEGSALGAVRGISEPRMEIYQPAQPNGTAVLILGGGGYFRIQMGTAAIPMAQWLSSVGVTAAVLYYRLPADGWAADAPFQDGQRALHLLRANAAQLGVDPQKIGVMGSSAGANLAGILATRFDHAFYPALDAADAVSARPDFLAMLYPVVSLKSPLDTTRTRRELGTQSDAVEAYSVESHVRADMPPVFLVHAADDPIADVRHSLVMLDAARAHDVPAEMHIFERGGHSWGMGRPGTLVAQWPRLFANWARSHGFMQTAPVSLQPLIGNTAVPLPPADLPDDAFDEEDGD